MLLNDIGKFLISFSFELSLIEGKTGTPEVPLSDLGFLSYLTWWSQRLIDVLSKYEGEEIAIADISKETSIKPTDIVMVLVLIGLSMTQFLRNDLTFCDTIKASMSSSPKRNI